MARKPTFAKPAQKRVLAPVPVPGAVQFDMASKISGRTYRIFVATPLSPPPETGYPVVVVTDGNLTFPMTAPINALFALGFGGEQPALVVGVGYPGDDPMTPFFMRMRDLTPLTPLSRIPAQPGLPPPQAENFGGAEEFYRFLVEELRPAIAEAYSVDPANQTLYGHSLAGLFTLGVMFRHPTAFRSFAASSPSIWWNRRALLKDEAAFAAKVSAGEITPRVLITVGATEQDIPDTPPPGMTRAQIRKQLTDARMVDNARDLAARLAKIKGGPGYVVRSAVFDQEDHQSVVAASLARTLTFALRP